MDRGDDTRDFESLSKASEPIGATTKKVPGVVGNVSMKHNEIIDEHFKGDFRMEDSPSYQVLAEHNLLCLDHRIANEADLELIPANSSRAWNSVSSCLCFPICFPLYCCGVVKNFYVQNGHLCTSTDGRGNFSFYGPGVHQIVDPFVSIGQKLNYAKTTIVHGDRTIVTVPQGYVGFCTEKGQPVLLPPGLHQWKSAMLIFDRLIDLNDPVITIGPWTLLTIDQGYMAVTQDNGRQVILDGGSVYLLTHRNWKFEKFVSTKIQTNELKRIEAASADNVVMLVDATVLWRIADVETAVRMSAETMDAAGTKQGHNDILKLRNDVLQQAEASLAFFIGTINFSDTMAAAAIHQRHQDTRRQEGGVEPVLAQVLPSADSGNSEELHQESVPAVKTTALYDSEKLRDAVAHANKITETYGVEIISINIISAIPKDENLQASLAAGAVAAAEAQMMETTAQGKGRAIEIEAAANAKQTLILAQADADADVLRAEGAKQAADLLAANTVATELAKIQRTGDAIAGKGNNTSFFFGADPSHLSALLSNSEIVRQAS